MEHRELDVRAARRYAALAFLTSMVPLLLLFWMGVRSVFWVASVFACGGLAGAGVALSHRVKLAGLRPFVVAMWGVLGLVAASRIAGPFMVVPPMALGLAVGMALFPRVLPLRATVGAGTASVVVPLLLEWAGIFPASYDFGPDRLCIRAQAVAFPEVPTVVYLLAVTLIPIVAVCVYLTRLRDRLHAAEERLRIQAWQLRQIVPAEDEA